MGSNNALSDREMLEKIKDQLEGQERAAWWRFRFGIGLTFIVVSLSVLLALWSLGKIMEPHWFALTLFSLILLILGLILILLPKGNRENRA